MAEDYRNDADNINEEMDEEMTTITLTLDDDSVLECMVLGLFEAGGNEYIALLPLTDSQEEDDDDGEVLIYRYVDHGEDDPELIYIESDEEYEAAADAFDELLDEADFGEEEE